MFKNPFLLGLIKKLGFDSDNTYFEELFKKGSIAFIYKVAGLALGYIFTLLITRTLGAESMGIYALSTTILAIITTFGNLGFSTALLRFVSEYSTLNRRDLLKEIYLKATKIIIPFSIILTILLFSLSNFISEYIFNSPDLSIYFRLISLAVLPSILSMINLESLRGLKKIKEYAFISNISIAGLSLFSLLILLIFFRNSSLPIVALLISHAFIAMYSYKVWRKHSKIQGITVKNELKTENIMKVALPLLFSSSLFLVIDWTDTIMLGIYSTEIDVGIYHVCLKLALLTSITLYAINSIAAPKFAEYYAKRDLKSLEMIVHQSTRLMFWTSVPIVLIYLIFPSFVLGIFGSDFKKGAIALIFLSIGQFVNVISGSVGYFLQMTGKEKVFQYIIFAATIINIILNMILIPRYGINGAAFASMVSISFWNLTSMFYIRANFKITTIYLPKLRN